MGRVGRPHFADLNITHSADLLNYSFQFHHSERAAHRRYGQVALAHDFVDVDGFSGQELDEVGLRGGNLQQLLHDELLRDELEVQFFEDILYAGDQLGPFL